MHNDIVLTYRAHTPKELQHFRNTLAALNMIWKRTLKTTSASTFLWYGTVIFSLCCCMICSQFTHNFFLGIARKILPEWVTQFECITTVTLNGGYGCQHWRYVCYADAAALSSNAFFDSKRYHRVNRLTGHLQDWLQRNCECLDGLIRSIIF